MLSCISKKPTRREVTREINARKFYNGDIDTRHLNGIDEIRGKIERTLGGLSASQHLISNHQVLIDGDNATCSCYLHAQHTLHGTEGGDNYVMAGRYVDKLIRVGTEWRIVERELILDWVEGNPKVLARKKQ